MYWQAEADRLLLKVWNAGSSLRKTAAVLVKAGYKVSRGAVAGRKDRLIKKGCEVTRKGKIMQPTEKVEKKPLSAAGVARHAKRRERIEPQVAQTVVEQIEAAGIEADIALMGVDYFENEGCKAILDVRGDWGLPRCCGQPRCYDRLDRESSYCPTHYDRFNTNAAGSRRTY